MSSFGHETVAALLVRLGRGGEFFDDAIRESLKELLALRERVASASPQGDGE